MTVREDIDAHMLAEFPREACGLVIDRYGQQIYLPCRNLATTAMEHFMLCPQDYADAEDRGTIVMLVHSHPNVLPTPSMGDLVACEASGLPWLIVAVYQDAGDATPHIHSSYRWEPNGYVAPLVGRQYAFGILDCYTLIQDWYKAERNEVLPDFDRRDEFWNRGEELYLDNYKAAGFEPIPLGDELEVGDLILLQLAIGNTQANHAGVYIGDSEFLHHPYRRLSVRQVYGGYWREKTRMIVRRVA